MPSAVRHVAGSFLICCLVLRAPAFAQTIDAKLPRFEVASVKAIAQRCAVLLPVPARRQRAHYQHAPARHHA